MQNKIYDLRPYVVIDPHFLVIGGREFNRWPNLQHLGSSFSFEMKKCGDRLNRHYGVVGRISDDGRHALSSIDVRVCASGPIHEQFKPDDSGNEKDMGVGSILFGRTMEKLNPEMDETTFHMKANCPGTANRIFTYELHYTFDDEKPIISFVRIYAAADVPDYQSERSSAVKGDNFVSKGFKEAAGHALFYVTVLSVGLTISGLMLLLVAYLIYSNIVSPIQ